MSNKSFLVLIIVIVVGVFGFIIFGGKNTPKQPQLGISHTSQGGTHILEGAKHPAYNSDPPSSGWHYNDANAPTLWGVYTQQVPDEVFLHNEEHGGVIITYKPDLPIDQIKKLQALFAPPYSNKNFTPSKAIVTPRAKDTHPIELAAWTVTYNLDSYDEAKLMDFYLQHVSHSPEATAGPTNTPINQASGQ
jgi:hypothetical protein